MCLWQEVSSGFPYIAILTYGTPSPLFIVFFPFCSSNWIFSIDQFSSSLILFCLVKFDLKFSTEFSVQSLHSSAPKFSFGSSLFLISLLSFHFGLVFFSWYCSIVYLFFCSSLSIFRTIIFNILLRNSWIFETSYWRSTGILWWSHVSLIFHDPCSFA